VESLALKDELAKAKAYALRFLKVRSRSEKEIRDHLARKSLTEAVIAQTLQDLKTLRLIDDRQFASEWIGWRLKKPFGLRRISWELQGKGIDKEIIKEEIQNQLEGYEEEKVLEALAQRYLARKRSDPQKLKRRVFAYLARRGFETEAIQKVINHL